MSRSVDELPPPGPTPAAGPRPFDGQTDDLAVKCELRPDVPPRICRRWRSGRSWFYRMAVGW